MDTTGPTGLELKRFISTTLKIPIGKLRARASSPGFNEVYIVPERSENHREPLRYLYQFPPEFGNKCMRIVYAGSDKLETQAWGGNIRSNMIAMRANEWRQLMAQGD